MPQNSIGDLGAVIWLIFCLCAVLCIAWITLRLVSKRDGGKGAAGSIKVLDRVIVGKDQSLLLIKCGSKTMLVSVTNGGSTVLTELSEEEISLLKTSAPATDFALILQNALPFGKAKSANKEDKRDGE